MSDDGIEIVPPETKARDDGIQVIPPGATHEDGITILPPLQVQSSVAQDRLRGIMEQQATEGGGLERNPLNAAPATMAAAAAPLTPGPVSVVQPPAPKPFVPMPASAPIMPSTPSSLPAAALQGVTEPFTQMANTAAGSALGAVGDVGNLVGAARGIPTAPRMQRAVGNVADVLKQAGAVGREMQQNTAESPAAAHLAQLPEASKFLQGGAEATAGMAPLIAAYSNPTVLGALEAGKAIGRYEERTAADAKLSKVRTGIEEGLRAVANTAILSKLPAALKGEGVAPAEATVAGALKRLGGGALETGGVMGAQEGVSKTLERITNPEQKAYEPLEAATRGVEGGLAMGLVSGVAHGLAGAKNAERLESLKPLNEIAAAAEKEFPGDPHVKAVMLGVARGIETGTMDVDAGVTAAKAELEFKRAEAAKEKANEVRVESEVPAPENEAVPAAEAPGREGGPGPEVEAGEVPRAESVGEGPARDEAAVPARGPEAPANEAAAPAGDVARGPAAAGGGVEADALPVGVEELHGGEVRTKVLNRIDAMLPEVSKGSTDENGVPNPGHPTQRKHIAAVLAEDGVHMTDPELLDAMRNIKKNDGPTTDDERAVVRVLSDDARVNRYGYTPEPVAYRARPVGEEGIPATLTPAGRPVPAQATSSLDDAIAYAKEKQAATGQPQEIIRPRELPDGTIQLEGPRGSTWFRFDKGEVPEHDLETIRTAAALEHLEAGDIAASEGKPGAGERAGVAPANEDAGARSEAPADVLPAGDRDAEAGPETERPVEPERGPAAAKPVTNKEELARLLEEEHGHSRDEAFANATLFQAQAESWARRHKDHPDPSEYYKGLRLAKGEGEGDLYQMAPSNEEIEAHLQPGEIKAKGKLRENVFDAVRKHLENTNLDEFVEAAHAGRAARGWYEYLGNTLKGILGDDTATFVKTLAATSPRQSVAKNLEMTIDVWEKWDKAGRPTDTKTLTKLFGPRDAKNPKGPWKVVDLMARGPNTRRALQGEELSGPKVKPFDRNIMGDPMPVTNDSWQALLGGWEQEIFSTPAGNAAGTHVVRAAAKELGWAPREGQETMWSFIKTLVTLAGETGDPYDALERMTHGDILKGAEIAQMLEDPDVRQRLERLGYDTDKIPRFTGREAVDPNQAVLGEEGSNPEVLGRLAGRVRQIQRDRLPEGRILDTGRTVPLLHFSPREGLETLLPRFQGEGQTGAERKRMERNPEAWAPYTNFYTEEPGTDVEAHRFGTQHVYRAEDRLTNEPGGLISSAFVGKRTYAQLRDQGYTGVYYKRDGQVHRFEPTNVEYAGRATGFDKPLVKATDVAGRTFNLGAEAAQIYRDNLEEGKGGFTVNPETGAEPESGYVVSTLKGRETPLDHVPTAKDINAFVAKNRDVLADPANRIGGWHRKSDDMHVLDVSREVADRDEALRLGRENQQDTIWDVANGDEIPVEGGAEPTEQKSVTLNQSGKLSDVKTDPLEAAIKNAYDGNELHRVLNESEAQSGPFDGGCLIMAKAIRRANGGGELVRIKSDANEAEHYGTMIDGKIYDADGAHASPEEWIKNFADHENVSDRKLDFATGLVENGEIPDDPRAEKQVAALLSRTLGQDATEGPLFPARGSITFGPDGDALMKLGEKADATTFMHEATHYAISKLGDLVDNAAPEFKTAAERHMRSLNRLAGAGDGARPSDWTTEQHERVASSAERYYRDGVAPTPGLKQAFNYLRNLFREVYASVKGTPLEDKLSKESKEAFAWMLGKDEAPQRVAGGVGDEAAGTVGSLRRDDVADQPVNVPLGQKFLHMLGVDAKTEGGGTVVPEPKKFFSLTGELKDIFGGYGLNQLQKAAPTVTDLARHQTAAAQKTVALMNVVAPRILDALGAPKTIDELPAKADGTKNTRDDLVLARKTALEQFHSALAQGRLEGIRDKLEDIQQKVADASPEELRQLIKDGVFDSMIQALDGRKGFETFDENGLVNGRRDLQNEWDVVNKNLDYPFSYGEGPKVDAQHDTEADTLARDFLNDTLDTWRRNIGRVELRTGQFEPDDAASERFFDDYVDTDQFQKALEIYKKHLEPEFKKAHALNEGTFADQLGPLDTYYPLSQVSEQAEGKRVDKTVPFRKPKNPNNYFATGLGDYDVSAEAMRNNLARAMSQNGKAAVLGELQRVGLMKTGRSLPDTIVWNGDEYKATKVPIGMQKMLDKNGRVVNVPAAQAAVPDWVARELEPILDPKHAAEDERRLLNHVTSAVTTFNMGGPTDAVYHSANMLSTLITKSPIVGTGLISRVASAVPLAKSIAAIANIISYDVNTPERQARFERMLANGQIPNRYGSSTYSRDYAATHANSEYEGPRNPFYESGKPNAKDLPLIGKHRLRMPMAFGPLIFGPEGIDIRARMLMDEIGDHIAEKSGITMTPEEKFQWTSQMGNYVYALEGRIERAAKASGFAPFFTAGRQMNVNALAALMPIGKLPSSRMTASEVGQYRAMQMTSGLVGVTAAWAVMSKLYRGKWPWEDDKAKLFQIPLNDDDRNSVIGRKIWGDDVSRTGYVNIGFANPLMGRGLRITGLGQLGTGLLQGRDMNEIVDRGSVDVINGILHPVLGPPVHTFMNALTGQEAYLQRMTRNGRPDIQLKSAFQGDAGHGLARIGRNLAHAAVGANPIFRRINQAHEEGQPASRVLLDTVAPNLIKGPTRADYSPLETYMSDYAQEHPFPGEPSTPERRQGRDLATGLTSRLRVAYDKNDNAAAAPIEKEADDALAAGKLLPSEYDRIFKNADAPEHVAKFARLPLENSIEAFKRADDAEKVELADTLEKKIAGDKWREGLTDTEAAAVEKQVNDLLDESDKAALRLKRK